MRVIDDPTQLRSLALGWRRDGRVVALVPTMGALHAGHLSLVRRARLDSTHLIVSIFVNPLQFGPHDDWARYPRNLEADLALLEPEGVEVVFVPTAERMYAIGASTRVVVDEIGDVLEGARRPGHFQGVATVVLKLFNLSLPNFAYFGEKDAQQLAVLTRMARDLDTGIGIVAVPTVRESDGLALSSRNAYLSAAERSAAPCLWRALSLGARLYREHRTGDPAVLLGLMREVVEREPLAHLDYLELVDPATFSAPGPLAVGAVRIGSTRLIDNLRLDHPSGGFPPPPGALAVGRQARAG
ncbi:MAG TPA: pantoate--beta-alanine ligase [Candidatus Acidoferrales bacterium]|nr:pantoate--beta-alanine ligase [Candidatus Acidoferrales bacterium]